jgi:hypothetical protein
MTPLMLMLFGQHYQVSFEKGEARKQELIVEHYNYFVLKQPLSMYNHAATEYIKNALKVSMAKGIYRPLTDIRTNNLLYVSDAEICQRDYQSKAIAELSYDAAKVESYHNILGWLGTKNTAMPETLIFCSEGSAWETTMSVSFKTSSYKDGLLSDEFIVFPLDYMVEKDNFPNTADRLLVRYRGGALEEVDKFTAQLSENVSLN